MPKPIPNHGKNHRVIIAGLECEAKECLDWTSDGHALYGYVLARNNCEIFLNIIDPCDAGSYKLEASSDNGESTFFEDENLSPESVVDIVKRICRHPEEFDMGDDDE